VSTHYDVLGVRPDATVEEIKRAYVRRARVLHPDAHASSATVVQDEAERAMRELNIAWNTLRDTVRRRRYDVALRKGQPIDATGAGRRARRARKAPVLELGSGFQYWMGGVGVTGGNGQPTYNLRVTGATSLAPLAALAPDRLVALHAPAATIGDDDLVHLRDMTALRVLDLTGTRVTDVGLLHLLGCTSLETLWLWNTRITDAGLDLVARMPNLRQLGLGNTRVTDAGLAAFRRVTSLRLLQLWGTDVEGPGLEHLHGLSELEMVTLPWRVRGRHRRRLRAALPASVVA
jgi:hypothetical protein